MDQTYKDKDKDLTHKDQDKDKDLNLVLKESLRTRPRTRITSLVVRGLDLRSTGREFESRPPRCRLKPLANYLHTGVSVAKQYNLVTANGQ